MDMTSDFLCRRCESQAKQPSIGTDWLDRFVASLLAMTLRRGASKRS
jgi:hypothetical protein